MRQSAHTATMPLNHTNMQLQAGTGGHKQAGSVLGHTAAATAIDPERGGSDGVAPDTIALRHGTTRPQRVLVSSTMMPRHPA